MTSYGKEPFTNMAQLSSREYLRRSLGHHVDVRWLTNKLNSHLAGRKLLAASSGLDIALVASESADDRILARDTSKLMMKMTPTAEMAEILGLSGDELGKACHAYAVLQVDSAARSRSTPRSVTLVPELQAPAMDGSMVRLWSIEVMRSANHAIVNDAPFDACSFDAAWDKAAHHDRLDVAKSTQKLHESSEAVKTVILDAMDVSAKERVAIELDTNHLDAELTLEQNLRDAAHSY